MSWAPASDAHGRAMAPVGFLLGVMLAELTLGPFIIVLTTGGLVMIRVLGVIVLLAALSVTGTPSAAVALLTAALVLHLVASISESQSAAVVAETFRLVFRCYVVWRVVRRVLRDRIITLDTVAGAACVYFLLGMIWADLFFVLERWRPGSFHVPAMWMVGSDRALRSAIGDFSFATLTTLGTA